MLSPGITYREDFRCWWPNYDRAPEKNYAWVRRHVDDLELTVNRCRKKRVCVQAGGHAGLWPIRLSRYFEIVHTWEPEPALYACLMNNVREYQNIFPHPAALGSFAGVVLMQPHCTAGSWRVVENGSVSVFQTTIDAKCLRHCDAIFLDIEGSEVEALRGAANTIEQCSPVLHLEERARKGGNKAHEQAIQNYVKLLGYQVVDRVNNDVIYARR